QTCATDRTALRLDAAAHGLSVPVCARTGDFVFETGAQRYLINFLIGKFILKSTDTSQKFPDREISDFIAVSAFCIFVCV
ncbi:MAG: hypothetical protein RR800_12505, partial [Comamonas sp.]